MQTLLSLFRISNSQRLLLLQPSSDLTRARSIADQSMPLSTSKQGIPVMAHSADTMIQTSAQSGIASDLLSRHAVPLENLLNSFF